MLRDCRLDNLPVVDEEDRPLGIVDVQDCLDLVRGAATPEGPGPGSDDPAPR